MTQEELVQKLTESSYGRKSELTLEWIKPNENGFKRTLSVTTRYGFNFEILWFHNLCTIYLGNNIKIWFTDIWLDSNYPHRSYLDIRTSFMDVDSGFVIPVLYYDDKYIQL